MGNKGMSKYTIELNTDRNVINFSLLDRYKNKYTYQERLNKIVENITRELPINVWLLHMEVMIDKKEYHDILIHKTVIEIFNKTVMEKLKEKDNKGIERVMEKYINVIS